MPTPLTDAVFNHAVRRLSYAELQVLYRATADGALDADLTPRERVAAFYRRQKQTEFMAWMRTLDIRQMAAVYSRLRDGEDPDRIRADFPLLHSQRREASAFPEDGNDDNDIRTRHRCRPRSP